MSSPTDYVLLICVLDFRRCSWRFEEERSIFGLSQDWAFAFRAPQIEKKEDERQAFLAS